MLSRNVASSRAIPVEKMIDMVMVNPATPVFWGKNQGGMQSKDELTGESLEIAKKVWLESRDRAVESAKALRAVGLHKQYVNRTIENFMYVVAIVSGTDFENFFALRAHPDAQPEFQALAYKMLELYNENKPVKLLPGQWHIPFGDKIDKQKVVDSKSFGIETGGMALGLSGEYDKFIEEFCIKIAIARCARVSYLNFDGKDDYDADIKLCNRLFSNIPRHLSPTEHVAQCLDSNTRIGNFTGWKQYRYFFLDQNLKDDRVKK